MLSSARSEESAEAAVAYLDEHAEELDKYSQKLAKFLHENNSELHPRHLIRLQVLLNETVDADALAVQECTNFVNQGKYSESRELVLMFMKLTKQKVSRELIKVFNIVHSYLLVKRLIKMDNH